MRPFPSTWTRRVKAHPWTAGGLALAVVAVAGIVTASVLTGLKSTQPALVFAAAAQAIAAVVLVVITAWYARATWTMADHMKHQTDALLAPLIVVRLERVDQQVALVIGNDGRSAATDLYFGLDRAVPTKDRRRQQPLREHRLFKRPLPLLAPGSSYRLVIGPDDWVGAEAYNEFIAPFTVTVAYTWKNERIQEAIPLEAHLFYSFPELLEISRHFHLHLTTPRY